MPTTGAAPRSRSGPGGARRRGSAGSALAGERPRGREDRDRRLPEQVAVSAYRRQGIGGRVREHQVVLVQREIRQQALRLAGALEKFRYLKGGSRGRAHLRRDQDGARWRGQDSTSDFAVGGRRDARRVYTG